MIHLHLFPLLFWQNSFIYLFLNSDESIYEAKHKAIKFHSLPLKVSLLPFTASSNVQHFTLHGMLSSKASYNEPLQEPPSRLFASATGAFKPFYPTTQTRDLGFHPWIWAWKHTGEFQPQNLYWIHILFIFYPKVRKRESFKFKLHLEPWLLSWRALCTKGQDNPDEGRTPHCPPCGQAKTCPSLPTWK